MAKSVAINVGVNRTPKWGRFRGPIFSDGSFEFIHIPWQPEYGSIEPPPKKYKNKCYKSYVPKRLWNSDLVESPNFKIHTYASSEGARVANKAILDLKPKRDFLLFHATLKFKDEKGSRQDWINPDWGAYIVGLFKIDLIYERSRILFEESAIEAFEEYDFYKVLLNQPDPFNRTPWVKGMKGESGLLEKAIPLSNPNNSQKWSDLAFDFFRTSRDRRLNKSAIYKTVLTCKGECLDKLLAKCILRKNNG